jgi:hypothetical protein
MRVSLIIPIDSGVEVGGEPYHPTYSGYETACILIDDDTEEESLTPCMT